MVIRQVNEQAPLCHVSRYIDALYWSVTHHYHCGIRDITPITPTEKIYAILAMLMGLGFYGFLIGNITSFFKKDPRPGAPPRQYGKTIGGDKISLPASAQRRIRLLLLQIGGSAWALTRKISWSTIPHSLKRQVALHFKERYWSASRCSAKPARIY